MVAWLCGIGPKVKPDIMVRRMVINLMGARKQKEREEGSRGPNIPFMGTPPMT
jgi:hypothetical protein